MNGRRPKRTPWRPIGLLVAATGILAYVLLLALRPEPEASLGRAREHMRNRWFHKAAATLSQVLEDEPENLDARIARGTCFIRTSQHRKAREDFREALRLRPGFPPAELGLAELLWAEEKYDEARAAAQKVADAHPGLSHPFTLIGKAHYKLFEREARECVRILEDRPPSAQTFAAATEIRRGRFESAEACWQRWHDTDPAAANQSGLRTHLDRAKEHFRQTVARLTTACGKDGAGDPEAWVFLAAVLFEAGENDAAEKAVDRALQLPDADPVQATLIKVEVLNSRAAELIRQATDPKDSARAEQAARLNAEAIRRLEALVREHPDVAAARSELALLYVRAGRFDEAGELARETLKKSSDVKAAYVKAIVHLAKGEYDDAATEFLSVRNKMANEPRLHFGLGLAYYRRGGDTAAKGQAIQQFQQVVKLRPNFVPARLRLARLYLLQGWYEEARRQCEAILAIPGRPARLNARVYLVLSEAFRGLKQYDQVLQVLHKAAEEAPEDSSLLAREAVRIQMGMTEEVIRQYQRDKTNPIYLCIVGQALLQKGERKQAIENFRLAIQLDPQFIMSYVYLAGAYEAQGEPAAAAAEYGRAIKMLRDLQLPSNPSLHFGLALVRIKQGRFAEAETELRTVLELSKKAHTEHPAARLRLAAMELRKPRPDFALALGEVTSVIRHHETAEARFLAGLIHSAAARRPAEAIRAGIRARYHNDPAHRDREITDADVDAQRQLSWEKAVHEYERAIELDPRFRFSYEVALIYAMQRRFDKMAAVCQRALKVSPPSGKPLLLRRLAIARLGLRDARGAVKAAQEALGLSLGATAPDSQDVLQDRFLLVNARIASGKFEAARTEIEKISGVLPGFRDAYLAMVKRFERLHQGGASDNGPSRSAWLHEAVGLELSLAMLFSKAGVAWLPAAEHTYRRLLLKDPQNVAAMRYLSDLYIVTRQYDRAREINRRLLDERPGFALALRSLAAIEDLQTRAVAAAKPTPKERIEAQSKAIELYESAIEAAPKFWLPRLELAALYQRAGVNDKAMKLYEEVIALNPRQAQALNDYANLCAEEKRNLDRAIEYARKAKQLSPFDGAVADTLGVLHTLLGQPGAAVEQLEQARYLLPSHPAVQYHLAVAYEKTGEKAKALSLLDDLIGRDAKFPERAEAEALRNRLRSSP